MLCKCGGKTQVVNTREPRLDDSDNRRNQYVLDEAENVIGWYCQDYRARHRKCKECGEEFFTVELSVKDLQLAFEEKLIQSDLVEMKMSAKQLKDTVRSVMKEFM